MESETASVVSLWNLLPNIPYYIGGPISFVLLVVASWCVGEGGEILGKKYDASIIGGLIIAWLNTAPEAIFFITALNSNNPRFAVGAVSGSTIVVCTVALGCCLWIGCNARKSGNIILQPAVKKQCMVLGASIAVTTLVAVTGFSVSSGALGIMFYLVFLFYSLTGSTAQVAEDTDNKQQDEEMGEPIEEDEEEVPTSRGIAYLVTGGLLIIIFSSPFINSVVYAASSLKVNPILLAFFLAPIASEAPEILESISLSRKGSSQNINIAYSNLVGGTITKTTLLCGVFCFYGTWREFAWETPSYPLSLTLLSICAAVAAGIGGLFQKQTKWHGVALIVLFVVTAAVQYFTNIQFEEEMFVDEGFAHDDKH